MTVIWYRVGDVETSNYQTAIELSRDKHLEIKKIEKEMNLDTIKFIKDYHREGIRDVSERKV